MTIVKIAPSFSRLAGHTCALGAAACLLMSGAFDRTMSAQTAPTLKVMDWNIHHGVDPSNVNNLDRVVTSIVAINPHVVSLNEVEKENGYNGNADEPALLEAALESRTGVSWYGCFAQRTGAATGQGNLVLSRIRIESCESHLLSDSRSVARATITVNNVLVSVFSTHLDEASAAMRTTQVTELTTWALTASGERVVMGDFNASATSAELQVLRTGWEDAWATAVADGTEVSYSGNTAGNTRNSRIDYIWRKSGGAHLALQSAQVHDTGTISDHRPVSAIYTVITGLTVPAPPTNVRVVR
jgi:endonuclease/exonuclease/phosphatase family metal-dependent hydrolase